MKRIVICSILLAAFVIACGIAPGTATAAPNPDDSITLNGFSLSDTPQDVVNKSKDYVIITNIEGLTSNKQLHADKYMDGDVLPPQTNMVQHYFRTETMNKVTKNFDLAAKANYAATNSSTMDHARYRAVDKRMGQIQLQDSQGKAFRYMNFVFIKDKNNAWTLLTLYVTGDIVKKVPDVFNKRYGEMRTETAEYKGRFMLEKAPVLYWEKPGQLAAVNAHSLADSMYLFNLPAIESWSNELKDIATTLLDMREQSNQAKDKHLEESI